MSSAKWLQFYLDFIVFKHNYVIASTWNCAIGQLYSAMNGCLIVDVKTWISSHISHKIMDVNTNLLIDIPELVNSCWQTGSGYHCQDQF